MIRRDDYDYFQEVDFFILLQVGFGALFLLFPYENLKPSDIIGSYITLRFGDSQIIVVTFYVQFAGTI